LSYGVTFVDGEINSEDKIEKHTFDDFGLYMTSLYIPEPEPKVNVVDLPFSSGSVDLTEAIGTTPYKDRNGLQLEFKLYDGNYVNWEYQKMTLSMFVNGKKLKMITDSDPGYYYIVRLRVDTTKSNKSNSKIVLTGTADPFKYAVTASNDPWKWDTLNFINGVIVDTSDITVSNYKRVTILAGEIPTCPEFYVEKITDSIKVQYEGKDYKFDKSVGRYRFPQIRIDTNHNVLDFIGNGKVSISYRGRAL